jgi:hypothetical protein
VLCIEFLAKYVNIGEYCFFLGLFKFCFLEVLKGIAMLIVSYLTGQNPVGDRFFKCVR